MSISERAKFAERLSWLHDELTAKRYPNPQALVEKYDVPPTVGFRDLDYLKYIIHAPLEYSYDRGGFFYSTEFELPELRLTEAELIVLLVISQLRHAYEGAELEQIITDAQACLTGKLEAQVTLDLESLDQILRVEIEPFQHVDLKIFQELLTAIRNKESIVIKYFSGQKAVVVEKPCDPYHLLNFKDNWYLVAFCHEKQDYRDFLCSRIMEVEHSNVTFMSDPDFSLEEHKRDSQLFASEAPPIEIVAEFDKYAAHWIRMKQVHPSQKVIERADGSVEVSFRVTSMENIMRWILSFGEHARILAPQELQERVRRTISRMNYLYNRF